MMYAAADQTVDAIRARRHRARGFIGIAEGKSLKRKEPSDSHAFGCI